LASIVVIEKHSFDTPVFVFIDYRAVLWMLPIGFDLIDFYEFATNTL